MENSSGKDEKVIAGHDVIVDPERTEEKRASKYKAEIWRKAMFDAEREVMAAVAVPIGGREKDEGLLAYVQRANRILEDAVARWSIAKAEMEAAERKVGSHGQG